MNELPEEIEQEICSYLMTCNSHHKYIYNKTSLQYYKKQASYRFCAPIRMYNKDICQFCDAKTIRYIKMATYSSFS